VRWGRRIAGILGTAALLGVAAYMGSMIAPARNATPAFVPKVQEPQAKAKAKHKAKPKHTGPKLSAAQLAARTDAISVLRTRGYVAVNPAAYNPRHVLRVLIGYQSGNPLGPRRAFFFVGTRFIGNDAADGSSSLKLKQSGKRWATLAYGVFAPGGKVPSNTAKVRFAWDGSSLAPQGAIPLGRLASQ
jgi:hypothetical protein